MHKKPFDSTLCPYPLGQFTALTAGFSGKGMDMKEG